MTPQSIARNISHAMGITTPTTNCPKCGREMPEYRVLNFTEGGIVIWHGCAACLQRVNTQQSPSPITPDLVRRLWHLVTQPHSAAEVDAAAVEVQRVLRGK